MLYLILAAGTLFTYIWFMLFREKLRLNPITAVVAAIVHTLFGVACVKVFAAVEVFRLSAISNMSIFGATFLMPLLFFAFAKIGKRNMADVFDIGTVSMMFTLMCSRFNCIVTGCCKGLPFFGSDSFRWPTRELEIIFYIVLIVIRGTRVRKNNSQGTNYPIYMVAYGAFRFITEWVRVYDSNSIVHRAHVWAIISLCLGISILSEIKSHKTNKKETNNENG